MSWVDIIRLIVSIIACEAIGLVGAVFTFRAIPTWYAGLAKPGFTPPNWVFGPAWGTLYLLMAVSAFLVWRNSGKLAVGALAIFLVQLLLNLSWSIVFFGMRSPGGGVIVIVALWLAILATIVSFYRISVPAAWLLVPYILWVTFAAALNISVWLLNRGATGPA